MQSLANAEGKLQICQPPLSGERPWWIVAVRRDVNQLQLWLNGEKEADASILGDPGKYKCITKRERAVDRAYMESNCSMRFLFSILSSLLQTLFHCHCHVSPLLSKTPKQVFFLTL